MTTEITSVYIVGTQSIDLLDYESTISRDDLKNLKKIRPLDKGYHVPEARVTLGPCWHSSFRNVLAWGVPIDDAFVPKSYYFKGPVRQIADFSQMYGLALVSQKFKDVVEGLEPNVHQFFPVQCYWPRKKPVEGQFYWFHVCNALDSIDGDASGLPPREVIYSPVYERDVMQSWNDAGRVKNKIFSVSKIGNCHIWRDKYLVVGLWATSVFQKACEEAGITGISKGEANAYGVSK